MKRFFIFITLLFLSQPFPVLGGMISEQIKASCPDRYSTHEDSVNNYSVRMEEDVQKFGCGVIDVYALLAEDNIEIVETLEKDEFMMAAASEIFMDIPGLVPAIKKDPTVLESILLTAKADETAFLKLKEVLSTMGRFELKRIARNSRYFLYTLSAMMMASDEATPDEIKHLTRRLQKKVALRDIDTYMFLSIESFKLYPKASIEKRMGYVDITFTTIGKKTLRRIQPYKHYLIYFLPPDTSHIDESQNLSRNELDKIQSDYVSLMSFVFDDFAEIKKPEFGLFMAEMLSGYILDALRYHDNSRNEIREYLYYQFRSDLFCAMFSNYDPCDQNIKEQMNDFFVMYSPADENTGEVLSEAKGNLGLIAKWFRSGGKNYMDSVQPDNWRYFAQAMCYLPKIRDSLSGSQVRVFEDLLLDLSEDFVTNGLFVIWLFQKTDYFKWVSEGTDALAIIKHNPDVYMGCSAKKYKFILLTSYPKDRDPSLFQRFAQNEKIIVEVLVEEIQNLMTMNKVELEEHNFTNAEKRWALAEVIIDTTDNVILVVSIATVPFTAGASTTVVAMMAARKSAKIAAKKAYKTLAKRGLKSGRRLVKLGSKEGRKIASREARELIGFAAKRGRKNLREEAMKKTIRKTDNYMVGVTLTYLAVEEGVKYFLSQSMIGSGMKDLCPEPTTQD